MIVIVLNAYLYGVVSIEPIEPNEKSGLSGEVDLAFKESSGNTQRKDYSTGAKLQYDYVNHLNYIIGNYLYAESNNEKIEDKSFVHYRHINRINDALVWELYAQSEKSEFINLKLRELIGVGIRLRFFKSDTVKFYFGLGAYDSKEIYEISQDIKEIENAGRANSYISYKQKIADKFEATATFYHQPVLDNSNDYYLVANGNAKIFLTQQLAMKISAGIKEDSKPFEGNKKSDRYYILGLGYKF